MSASYERGAMLQGGHVHRPGTCPKFVAEDDVVVQAMCGQWVFHPGIPCQCDEKPDPVLVAAAQGGQSPSASTAREVIRRLEERIAQKPCGCLIGCQLRNIGAVYCEFGRQQDDALLREARALLAQQEEEIERWRSHYEAAVGNWNEVIRQRDALQSRLEAAEARVARLIAACADEGHEGTQTHCSICRTLRDLRQSGGSGRGR